jgi:hypothetical protein
MANFPINCNSSLTTGNQLHNLMNLMHVPGVSLRKLREMQLWSSLGKELTPQEIEARAAGYSSVVSCSCETEKRTFGRILDSWLRPRRHVGCRLHAHSQRLISCADENGTPSTLQLIARPAGRPAGAPPQSEDTPGSVHTCD